MPFVDFSLKEGLSEKKEVSADNPEKVKELEKIMMKMLVEMKALIPHKAAK
jgi:hypothetical protein